MKKYLILCLLSSGIIYAQNNTGVILDSSSNSDSIYFDENRLQEYIELAFKNSPVNKIASLRTYVAKKDIELARWSWTETLVAQFNLNESNINSGPIFGTSDKVQFYPRYLFGLRLSLGTFVQTPLETQKAKELYKISLAEKDNQKASIINEVTRRYQNYVLKKKSLALRLDAADKFGSLYKALQNSGQRKDLYYLEKEAQIFNSYTEALEAKNTAEAQARMAKADLEQIIGMKLDQSK